MKLPLALDLHDIADAERSQFGGANARMQEGHDNYAIVGRRVWLSAIGQDGVQRGVLEIADDLRVLAGHILWRERVALWSGGQTLLDRDVEEAASIASKVLGLGRRVLGLEMVLIGDRDAAGDIVESDKVLTALLSQVGLSLHEEHLDGLGGVLWSTALQVYRAPVQVALDCLYEGM